MLGRFFKTGESVYQTGEEGLSKKACFLIDRSSKIEFGQSK